MEAKEYAKKTHMEVIDTVLDGVEDLIQTRINTIARRNSANLPDLAIDLACINSLRNAKDDVSSLRRKIRKMVTEV